MLFRRFSILALTLPLLMSAVVRGQEVNEEYNDAEVIFDDADMIISEEFLGFEMSAFDFVESDEHFLRRDLQSDDVRCRPVSQPRVSLRSDDANYCSELGRYDCTCNGSAEASCTFCRLTVLPIDSPNGPAYRCQVSGSLVTFMDNTNKAVTCACEYANGKASHKCYVANTAVPIPAPALAVAQQTANVRAPVRKAVFVTGPVQGVNVNSPARAPVRPPVRPAGTRE